MLSGLRQAVMSETPRAAMPCSCSYLQQLEEMKTQDAKIIHVEPVKVDIGKQENENVKQLSRQKEIVKFGKFSRALS